MTRSTVVANNELWTVNDLESRARGRLFQALVVAQLVDGATGAPIASPIRVAAGVDGLRPRVAGSGFAGLVGIPTEVLPLLGATGYPPITVAFGADGYETRHEPVTFTQQVGFPAIFADAVLGALPLRRTPSVVSVASYDLDPANRPRPLAGATVDVTGWWATVGNLGSAPVTTPLLGVGPGLSVARPTANLDLPALAAPAEPPRSLTAGVAAAATSIAVSTAGALAVGDLVGLDLADPDRAERVEVTAIDGAADPLSPAVLTLLFPLRSAHSGNAPVVRLVAPAPGPPLTTQTAVSFEGDRTLSVSSLAGLAAGQVVRISGGGAAAEYRTTARYQLVTNADGGGRFPALSGAAAVAVTATAGAANASARLSLTRPAAAIDLTLT